MASYVQFLTFFGYISSNLYTGFKWIKLDKMTNSYIIGMNNIMEINSIIGCDDCILKLGNTYKYINMTFEKIN